MEVAAVVAVEIAAEVGTETVMERAIGGTLHGLYNPTAVIKYVGSLVLLVIPA